MQALRAQMNPHFIFNSLNSINMFILENNKLAGIGISFQIFKAGKNDPSKFPGSINSFGTGIGSTSLIS